MIKRLLLYLVPIAVALSAIACEPEEEERGPVQPLGCQQGLQSRILLPQGLLASGEFWACEPPRAGAGQARFLEYEGIPFMVTGGSSRFLLHWVGAESIQGRMMITGVTGEDGYYAVDIPSDDNPLELEIFISQSAIPGDQYFFVAIDDGTGTPEHPKLGGFLSIPINILRVGGGDVQVSLNWDTPTDVDLHVIDPAGEEVYWFQRESASGGQLDLDSNAGCNLDNKNNENIFWNTGRAPYGDYTVRVDYWSACNLVSTGFPTQYRVTVVLDGRIESTHDGVFQPDEADAGGADSGVEITSFTWSGF